MRFPVYMGHKSQFESYQWLHDNIGPRSNGWQEIVEIEKTSTPGRRCFKFYIDIDNEADAMAYKLKFGL
jgi:hypothetical protein